MVQRKFLKRPLGDEQGFLLKESARNLLLICRFVVLVVTAIVNGTTVAGHFLRHLATYVTNMGFVSREEMIVTKKFPWVSVDGRSSQ